MITDTIENAAQYENLSEAITKGLKILSDKNLINQSDGRYDVDGNNLFFLIQRYTTKPLEQGRLEAHQNYIDIQYVVSGQELIGYAPAPLWPAPVLCTSCYESISHVFSLSCARRSVAEPCSRHLAANAAGAI